MKAFIFVLHNIKTTNNDENTVLFTFRYQIMPLPLNKGSLEG